MKKFSPTKQQEDAFNEVAKAIKKAKKLGLVFYAKSSSLTAYTQQADDYIEKDFLNSLGTGFNQIDCISQSGLISDSGADDYPAYRTLEDQEKYE